MFPQMREPTIFLVKETRLKARQSKSVVIDIKYVMLKYSYSYPVNMFRLDRHHNKRIQCATHISNNYQ